MGKKSKVNKLARMSDEERARYLQHRADLEEEARRRKRELIARFIKNKLDKEEGFSRTNTAKVNVVWRFILRRIKCKQMTSEIQGMMSSFNNLLERKNRHIRSLVAAIEDADDQHRRAFQAHAEMISNIISIGNQRLDELLSHYELQKNNFIEKWEKDVRDLSVSQEKADLQLKLIIFIQNRDFQNYKKASETERATQKNDARLEHEENMRAFWKPKQLEVEYYWGQLKEVYNTYVVTHTPILKHYNALQEQDEFYKRDIARNEVLIQEASETLLSLQNEYEVTSTRIAKRLQRLNLHKDELTKRHCQMKKDAKTMSKKSAEMMEVMVNASQDAIAHLEMHEKQANKILQLYEICCKYECEGDKICQNLEGETEDESVPVTYDKLDKDLAEECNQYSKMEKFLLKINRVKVQVMCLKAEKVKLTKENAKLKIYMKQCLTEMALKGDTDRPRSMNLQVKTESTDKAGKVMNRPVTCIEGALSNAVIHEKRMKVWEKRDKEIGVPKAYPRLQCWM